MPVAFSWVDHEARRESSLSHEYEAPTGEETDPESMEPDTDTSPLLNHHVSEESVLQERMRVEAITLFGYRRSVSRKVHSSGSAF